MKRLAALLLCLALLLGAFPGRGPVRALAAGVVTFADPNLEAAVRDALGNPDGTITAEDAASLTYLWAWGRSIHDLTGIDQLVNLEGLDLWYNEVSDISPLRGLPSLRWLYLSHNPVANLAPLSDLPWLDNLGLYGTRVTDLRPLKNLTQLWMLDLSNTPVKDLSPLVGLTNLYELDLSDTQVTNVLALRNMTGLENLDLSRSQVGDIAPLAELPQLRWLYLSGTPVRDLRPLASLTALAGFSAREMEIGDLTPLSSLKQLQYLDLSQNQIADLTPLRGLDQVMWLNLASNRITSLEPIGQMTDLQQLDIGNNQVRSVAPLVGMTSLRLLSASNNRITDTRPLTNMSTLRTLDLNGNAVSDLGGLAGMAELRTAWLGKNQITDISPVAGLTNLQFFNAAYNQITAMGALAGKPNLTDVDLSHNQVQSIPPLPGSEMIGSLSLSYNQVKEVPGLADLPHLSTLLLDWNQIESIAPLTGHADLEYLQLFGNQISDISPLAGSPRLRFLQAGRNQIRDMAVVAGLPELRSLGLYGNQITEMAAVANLPNLTWLHLGDNQISDISALAYNGAARIDFVDLSGNRISDAAGLVNLRPVKELSLARNRLADISPLVAVAWARYDTSLDLRENYIDRSNAGNAAAVDHLRSMGARVQDQPQRETATNVAAVVIDNSPQAGPPSGIAEAQVVYEVAVAPGITRLLALYDLSRPVPKIGPVRSSRDELVQLAAGHQGAFAHAGGSYTALKLASQMPVTNLDEIYGSGDAFYRDDAQEAPHNLYTSTDLLQTAIANSDRPAARPAAWFPVGAMIGGTPAAEATAHFTAAKQPTRFVWNGTAYARQVGSTPATDADGNPITAQNVVTLYAGHQVAYRGDVGEWTVQASLVGSGTAEFYRDGLTWTGRWSRSSASAPLTLTVGGKPFHFAEGNTWIMVADEKADQDGYINGKVTVAGRQDAGGVLVEALDAAGAQAAGVLTTANGAFRLKVPAGTYTLRATLTDFAAAPRTVTVAPGKTITLSLNLTPAFGDLTGTLTNKVTGKPVGWVAVRLLDAAGKEAGYQITTSGTFSFAHVAAGKYTVKATDEYYKDASAAVQVIGGKTQTVKLTMTPVVGSISGKVVDTSSPARPVQGARVTLVNSKGETAGTYITDSNGRFQFDPVPEGTYRLDATQDDYKTTTLDTVRVSGGQTKSVTMTMQYRYGTLSVRVADDRKIPHLLAGAAVTVLGKDGAVVAQGETDAKGRFAATDLPEGSYTVRVTRDGFLPPSDQVVTVKGGKETAATFKLTAAP